MLLESKQPNLEEDLLLSSLTKSFHENSNDEEINIPPNFSLPFSENEAKIEKVQFPSNFSDSEHTNSLEESTFEYSPCNEAKNEDSLQQKEVPKSSLQEKIQQEELEPTILLSQTTTTEKMEELESVLDLKENRIFNVQEFLEIPEQECFIQREDNEDQTTTDNLKGSVSSMLDDEYIPNTNILPKKKGPQKKEAIQLSQDDILKIYQKDSKVVRDNLPSSKLYSITCLKSLLKEAFKDHCYDSKKRRNIPKALLRDVSNYFQTNMEPMKELFHHHHLKQTEEKKIQKDFSKIGKYVKDFIETTNKKSKSKACISTQGKGEFNTHLHKLFSGKNVIVTALALNSIKKEFLNDNYDRKKCDKHLYTKTYATYTSIANLLEESLRIKIFKK